MKLAISLCFGGILFSAQGMAIAESPKPSGKNAQPDAPQTQLDEETTRRYERFTNEMAKVKLVGQFTVTGKDNGPLAKEEYTIHKVEKLPEGEKWMFHCRIKYGKHDLAIPLPIDVKWAGNTPIITLDDLTIPGMGTFSARVVLHENKYAGTWRHDQVGGHLFGTIEKLADNKAESPQKSKNEPHP